MPSIVGLAQAMTEQIPEFETNLRLKQFYKHRHISPDIISCFANSVALQKKAGTRRQKV